MPYSYNVDLYSSFSLEELKTHLAERVEHYASRVHEYRRQSYNETEVRVDFVNPFFKLLGWDVDNQAGLPQHLREVTHEATVLVDEDGSQKSKKPDYSFRIGTETFFYLETKKPNVNITTDSAPAFQLRRYGWSGNLKISVLTNYNDLYIYDCSVRPKEDDDVNVALIAHYTYEEYVEKFEEIYGLLSKEAVISGNFAKRFESIQGTFKREPFDEYFLKQIRNWRFRLGENIVEKNPTVDTETLNICVQRILNRIIFLRICEDRSFEKYDLLKNIQNYKELKKVFNLADKKYDSGLFETIEEDNVYLSDEILIGIFKDLYYPNSSYEFSVVDPFIIGQIYELFLEEKLVKNPNGTVIQEKKAEIVDSQGAVNTPKNITDIIVEQTLIDVFDNKPVDEVLKLRIADICCGSGNFLISAYEYAINYCLNWFLNNDKDNAIREGHIYAVSGENTFMLSYELKRKLLTSSIFGVDIDPLAVEVTKFSLLLKLLENTSDEEINAYSEKAKQRILPKLEDNILNGNSLVDMSFARYDPNIYQDHSKLKLIRMFDWNAAFGNDGFDAIVGNPPYIRVQKMVCYSPDEYEFYKSEYSGYEMAESDLLDKYQLFVEKAWNLLRSNGVLGYIIPHRFMTNSGGNIMRKYIANHHSLKCIIHFGIHQVFKGRLTYTCILKLSKDQQEKYNIAFVQDWNKFLFDHKVDYETYNEDLLDETPWKFITKQINNKLSDIKPYCRPLKEYSDVFVGIQTSKDEVYIIEANHEDDEYVYFTDSRMTNRIIEKGILKKCIYDIQISKYERIVPNRYVIFPYENNNGHPSLININDLRNNYPNAFAYLSDYRDELDRRSMPNRTEETWYAFGRSQSLRRFVSGEHLIWPVLSLDSNYVYDDDNIVFSGGGNGPFYGIEMKRDSRESIFYIQAILNHWLLELIVKQSANMFSGGYYSHGKQFIADLPVYKIDWNDEDMVNKHDAIVEKVHLIENLSECEKQAPNSSVRETYKRTVNAAKSELEKLIDELYGVEGLRMVMSDETNSGI